MQRRTLAAAFAALALLSPSAGVVHAQTQPSCAFDPRSFASLQKTRKDSSDTVREELQARKALLRATLDCLDEEVRIQRAGLNRTRVTDPAMQNVQHNLALALEDAARYYESQREGIPNAGLRAAKDTAANIRDWRANTFLPQQARIRAFTSWAHNEEFLATAFRRLGELERSVQLLTLIDRSDIQTLFTKASTNFRAAQEFHARAKTASINGLDPSPSIKLSLEALAQTYNSFIELSNLINALLPRGK